MHRGTLAVALAGALSAPLAPSNAVAQGRLPAPERPAAAWGRAAVLSPARSAALGSRQVGVPSSTGPYAGASRWWSPGRYWPPCGPWCAVHPVYVAVPVVQTGVGLAPIGLAPPRHGGAGCATVGVKMGRDRWRIDVALPALGAGTPAALFAAITREMAANRQVALSTPDGTRAILPAGPGVTGLVVEPCGPSSGAMRP